MSPTAEKDRRLCPQGLRGIYRVIELLICQNSET